MNAFATATALPSALGFPYLDRLDGFLGGRGSVDAGRRRAGRAAGALRWTGARPGAGGRWNGLLPYMPCSRCRGMGSWCADGIATSIADLGPAFMAAIQGAVAPPAAPATPAKIALGEAADPYSPAEATVLTTRGMLEALAELPATAGTHLSIVTGSALLLRDLDLLAELDQHHAVTVGVVLSAVDPRLRRRLEPHAPGGSAAPLDLIQALTAQGLAVRVICSPVRAGFNNGEAPLRRLFTLARDAGALDVVPAPHHPAAPPTAAQSQGLLALFHRLRLEHGFPAQAGPGRG